MIEVVRHRLIIGIESVAARNQVIVKISFGSLDDQTNGPLS
jgi:hypothetical protein